MQNKLKIKVTDQAELLKVIHAYPLATVITSSGSSSVQISHLPIVATGAADGRIKLWGHLSTKNPQWAHLKQGAEMTMIFHGPQTYINSSWYKVNDVSTWNYVTVQAKGKPVLEESYGGLLNILKATTDLTNELYADQWDFHIPEDLNSETDLTSAIGGFSLEPTGLEGRFKLSQSKSVEDQKRIITELLKREDENSKKTAEFMAKNIKHWSY